MDILVPVIDDFNKVILYKYEDGVFRKTGSQLPTSFSEKFKILKTVGIIKNCSIYSHVCWDSPTVQSLYGPWQSFYAYYREQARLLKLVLVYNSSGLSHFRIGDVVEVNTEANSAAWRKTMINRLYEMLMVDLQDTKYGRE